MVSGVSDVVADADICRLSCRPRRHRFFVHLAKTVVDGTRCRPLDPYHICVAGRCQASLSSSIKRA